MASIDESIEISLLREHAQTPTAEAILRRFAEHYAESLQRQAGAAAALPRDADAEEVADFEALAAEAKKAGLLGGAAEPAGPEFAVVPALGDEEDVDLDAKTRPVSLFGASAVTAEAEGEVGAGGGTGFDAGALLFPGPVGEDEPAGEDGPEGDDQAGADERAAPAVEEEAAAAAAIDDFDVDSEAPAVESVDPAEEPNDGAGAGMEAAPDEEAFVGDAGATTNMEALPGEVDATDAGATMVMEAMSFDESESDPATSGEPDEAAAVDGTAEEPDAAGSDDGGEAEDGTEPKTRGRLGRKSRRKRKK